VKEELVSPRERELIEEIERLRLRLEEPESTIEAIQSGAVYGFSGQVDAIVVRFEAELGQSTVVSTGGLAELIMPHSRTIQHFEPWLTLQGLRIVHERNR